MNFVKPLLILTLLAFTIFSVAAIDLKISAQYTGKATELLNDTKSTGVKFKAGKKAPVKVEFVIILDKPVKLDYVELISISHNKWWNINQFQLLVKSPDVNDFNTVIKASWYKRGKDNSKKTFSQKILLKGKYVERLIVIIKRNHKFLYMQLNKIKLVKTDGSVVFGKVNVVPYAEKKHKTYQCDDSVSSPVVDRYGQYIYESWPGKVFSDKQLHDEYKREAKELKGIKLDTSKFDKYGGVKRIKLNATGFFRVEQWRKKWWFVTPEGHPFIMNGPGAANPDEWGYSTPLLQTGNSKTSRKHLFAELPDKSKFSASYSKERFSFLMANLQRKYGDNFRKKFIEIIYKRLLKWGFNSYGKWTSCKMFFDCGYKLPYIANMRIRTKNKIKWAVDPFSQETLNTVKRGVERAWAKDKNNPWLIGYFFWSESGWNREVLKALLGDKKYYDTPAAAEFRKFVIKKLTEKYGKNLKQFQTALNTKLDSINKIADPRNRLKWSKFLNSIAGDFIRYAAKTFFGMVRNEYKKIGGKHLLLGSALTPGWRNDIEWSQGGAEFLDVVSVDYYGHDKKQVLKYARATGKPVINIEFNFSVKGRGMRNFHGGYVKKREEKGIAYARMIENCVADNYIIGFSPFILFDQPVTGRSCGSGKWGENYNTGFINTADQPYENYLKKVTETNKRLFDIHLGVVKPVKYTKWKYHKSVWKN